MCLLSLYVGPKYFVNITYCHSAIKEFLMLSEVCYGCCLCQGILSNIFHFSKLHLFYLSISQLYLKDEKISKLTIYICLSQSLFGELWAIDIDPYCHLHFDFHELHYIETYKFHFYLNSLLFSIYYCSKKFVDFIGRISV